MPSELAIGGQAVIEGVLFKSKNCYSIAVRKPNGRIILKVERYYSLMDRFKILKVPFFRGVIVLFEMLVLGMKALTYSANEALEEDEQISSCGIAATLLFALAAGIAVFVILPYALTYLVGFVEKTNPILFNVIDGGIKLLLFLGYLLAISRIKEIQRLFQYHGAEHKTVHCYEAKKKLTVKNVKAYSTIHARCGTEFLLLVLLIGVVFFSFVPLLVHSLLNLQVHWIIEKIILLAVRILFLLPIAAVSYEILKLGGKYNDTIWMKPIIWPGMFIQKITTQEPDNKQIEVAIKALEAVVKNG